MREDKVKEIRTALTEKRGQEVYDMANAALDEDEEDSQAWYFLMRSFELLLPVEGYQASNELTCGKYAMEYAAAEVRDAMEARVCSFYLEKALNVLEFEEKKLADAKEIAGFYQRKVYFDARNAGAITFEKDKPLIDAVRASFEYVFALFEGVPEQVVRENRVINSLCRKLARQWQRTYSYLEIRYEFYGKRLSDEDIRYGLERYAELLKDVAGAEEIAAKPVPFNLFQWDQMEYLRRARQEKRTLSEI